jgi:DNA-binding transcriptional regulator PaaX
LFQLREMIVQFLGARGDWVPFTRIVQVMKGTGFNRTEVIAQLDALKKAGVIEYQSLVGSSCAHLRVKLRRAGK